MTEPERMREAVEAGHAYVRRERDGGVHRPLVIEDVDEILALALPFLGGLPPKPNGLELSAQQIGSLLGALQFSIAHGAPDQPEIEDALVAELARKVSLVDACPSGCPPEANPG